MLVIDTKQITKTGGLYNLQADQNLAELKSIMKDLIVKERPSSHRPAVWASERSEYKKTTSSTQTDSSSNTSGGRVWAYQPRKKKEPKVKIFSL
jgi:hypothetical protein